MLTVRGWERVRHYHSDYPNLAHPTQRRKKNWNIMRQENKILRKNVHSNEAKKPREMQILSHKNTYELLLLKRNSPTPSNTASGSQRSFHKDTEWYLWIMFWTTSYSVGIIRKTKLFITMKELILWGEIDFLELVRIYLLNYLTAVEVAVRIFLLTYLLGVRQDFLS